MLSMLEMRRQKAVQPPTYRIENEYDPEAMAQCFQISVNIIEGHNYIWTSSRSTSSYVIIVLGNQKRRTSVRRNMRDPYYRETVVFEIYTSVNSLEQLDLWLAVMESNVYSTPKIIGEARIDLGAIWHQPFHQVLHKWMPLHACSCTSAALGFIKVDVSILLRGELNIVPAALGDENLMENLLLPSGSEQQCANFIIKIYGALGIPNAVQNNYAGKSVGKPPNTFVKVSFSGITAKTDTFHRTNNPAYCEQISIIEMFPNISQDIRFELCAVENSTHKVIASVNINLSSISHSGDNGYLPTFGPSLINMYGPTWSDVSNEYTPYHKGALLIAVNTVVPYYKQVMKSVNSRRVEPIVLNELWTFEDFCICCAVLEVSMLDCKVSGQFCGVAVTIADISGGNYNDETHKLHYTGCLEVVSPVSSYGYLNFNNCLPVLQLAMRLPDFRLTMYKNNTIQGIVHDMETALGEVDAKLNVVSDNFASVFDHLNNSLRDTVDSMNNFLGILGDISRNNDVYLKTELEKKQNTLQMEEIRAIRDQILEMLERAHPQAKTQTKLGRGLRRAVKLLAVETRHALDKMKYLIFNTLSGWPDLVFWLLSGGSRVAFARIPASDIIYSVAPKESGRYCGRIRTIYMKPLKCLKHTQCNCNCAVGKVETLCWMGLYSEQSAFETYLPNGYKLKVAEYDVYLKVQSMVIECRAFISKAKLNNHRDTTSGEHFVRINSLNSTKDTQALKGGSLQWNQVVNINSTMPYTLDRLAASPPTVFVEVFNKGYKGKLKLVGCCEILPLVQMKSGVEVEGQLRWHDLYKGVEIIGQLLMSIIMLQNPEKLLKTTTYSPIEEIYYATNKNNSELCENSEAGPISFIPTCKSYKVDIYWWGLRDINVTRKPFVVMEIEDTIVKSDTICNKESNSNFPDSRTSCSIDAAMSSSFTFNIKLYDSAAFGRTLLVAAKVVKNPSKYIISCLPKCEYDASMKNIALAPSEFIHVNNTLLIKRSCQKLRGDEEGDKYKIKGSTENADSMRENELNVKNTKWQRLFLHKVLDEEVYTLLPVRKKQSSADAVGASKRQGWWLRFLQTQEFKNTEKMDLMIYKSELESQPEFGKFKDWCTTLKLYNGEKTYTHQDKLLFCGYLKVGIALYKWPVNMTAPVASANGVDLSKGYFNEYPDNEPAKYLVRIYLVKGVKLQIGELAKQPNPYVKFSCGKKHFGYRHQHSTGYNPDFGKMHEFRCCLPDDYLLTIHLYNRDDTASDRLIGSTSIDLEDRIYSKHRARVGLATTYTLNGARKWRDCVLPSTILEDVCRKINIPTPVYPNSTTVILNGVEYRSSNSERSRTSLMEQKEILCLDILHKWYSLPICGYQLVPEHVETRSLYLPDKPEEQGKILMWVDIFPLNANIPGAVDIAPYKIETYELNVTVHTVKTARNKLCDNTRRGIYVKAWLGTTCEAQCTDVQYETANHDTQFDWKMSFNFEYQPGIEKLLRKEIAPATEIEDYVPPTLVIQIMDDISPDEYIGAIMVDINDFPRGVNNPKEYGKNSLKTMKRINLFSAKSASGWWPLQKFNKDVTDNKVGMIKMLLSLTSMDADAVVMNDNVESALPKQNPLIRNTNIVACRVTDVISNVFKSRSENRDYYCVIVTTVLCAITASSIILLIYFGPTIVLEHWVFI